MVKEVEVIFQPEGKRARIRLGATLLEAARLAGADLTSICGGKGKCGKCRVVVEKEGGNAGSITEVEKGVLSPMEMSAGYRLACCTSVKGQLIVKIPEESRTGRQRLQVEGIETPVKLEPLIRKYFVKLPSPTLQDPRSDVDRLLDELRVQHGLTKLKVSYSLLQRLPLILRDSEWKVTVVVWSDDTVICVESGDTTHRNFGYAVDMGTTKLAGYLLDLNTGKVMAVDSLMNPQIPYGEDVITRITHAMKGFKEQKELQKAVVSGINQILQRLLEKTGVNAGEVYEMTAVGNTAMHHLFLNVYPKYVALSPYPPAIRRAVDVNAEDVGVNISPNGNIHILPVIAGFVGADAVAVILATEIYKRNELCLSLDIGTNTEVVLGNKDEMLACSCASGPALEGAHIKHGMRAATGAIERVRIDTDTFEVEYWTVDNAKPRGICGSAMVGILAEMLKAGIIDVSGKMNRDVTSPRLRSGEDGLEFVVAWGRETSNGEDIVFTQRDIREIQLAKAAMHTGAMALMKKKGVVEEDIEIVFIAGAFGSYIDPENARMIGMYPEIPLEKVRVVGNAAGTGARMALASKTARRTAEEISAKVKYIELAAEPNFQAEFFNSNILPYADLARYPQTSTLLKKLGRYPKKTPTYFH
ncbi:MAG: ASKHA domain-containing protein [Candidatus Bathycorpusculaceae bacterium]